MERIKTQNAKHLYEVELCFRDAYGKPVIKFIPVEANTRSQASHLAAMTGGEVRSVNMIG